MAIKRIKKEQIESGKKDLPKKLAFLTEGKIDYANVGHDEASDEWTVELPLAAIRALARKAAELKEVKRAQKDVAQQAALVPALQKDRTELLALRETMAEADALMRKATRRISALEKQLGAQPAAAAKPVAPAKPEAAVTPAKAPVKATKATPKPAAKPKAAKAPMKPATKPATAAETVAVSAPQPAAEAPLPKAA